MWENSERRETGNLDSALKIEREEWDLWGVGMGGDEKVEIKGQEGQFRWKRGQENHKGGSK